MIEPIRIAFEIACPADHAFRSHEHSTQMAKNRIAGMNCPTVVTNSGIGAISAPNPMATAIRIQPQWRAVIRVGRSL